MTDQIHLVHRHDDVPYAQQRTDQRVPARLHQHALARIDKNDGQFGIRGAGRHVAGILLVPGSIRDDEGTSGSGEEAVGHVDGDALLALRLQPVDQQRKIDILLDSAVALGVFGERHKLIFKDEFRVVQQPPDQGGFAVVDRSAGDEAEKILGRHAFHGRLSVSGKHQKYPSRFFFSIDDASSLSIRRPCRSDTRALRISATMSSSELASDSMAPVSG